VGGGGLQPAELVAELATATLVFKTLTHFLFFSPFFLPPFPQFRFALLRNYGYSSHYNQNSRQSAGSKRPAGTVSPTPSASKNKNKKKRVSTRLFNEPEFEELLSTWEENSLALGAWSMGMHALLKERFPTLLTKYNYFETDKKVHLCQYLFEKSNKRKEAAGHIRVIKRINK